MSDVIDRDGFRANVGMMLISGDGKLFIARRTGGRGWQFPQGGMRSGETDEQSLFRELMEDRPGSRGRSDHRPHAPLAALSPAGTVHTSQCAAVMSRAEAALV